MELNDRILEQLEKLWNGLLPEPDKSELESRLSNDPDFGQAALEYKTTLLVYYALREEALRAQFSAIETARKNRVPPKSAPWKILFSNPGRYWIAAAAVSALLVYMAADGLKTRVSPESIEDIANTPYRAPGHQMNDKSRFSDTDMKDAFEAFNKREYDKAEPLFKRYFETSNDTTALFFSGMIAYFNKRYEAAAPLFNAVYHSNCDFNEEAEWRLAASFALLGKTQESEAILEKIISENRYYKPQAEALTRALGRHKKQNIRQ
jgi:hypothetical protein